MRQSPSADALHVGLSKNWEGTVDEKLTARAMAFVVPRFLWRSTTDDVLARALPPIGGFGASPKADYMDPTSSATQSLCSGRRLSAAPIVVGVLMVEVAGSVVVMLG
jgi:hypothetical protein